MVPRARLTDGGIRPRRATRSTWRALSLLEFDMLHLRRFARPSTLALALLLGMQGGAWAQQPPAEAAAVPSSKAPLPLDELRLSLIHI